MFEFVKKTMYTGLGLAAMTREKVESVAKDIAHYTNMSEEEGRKLAQYLHDESEKARDNIRQMVDRSVDSALEHIPSRKRVRELEARVAALEEATGVTPPEPEAEESQESAAGDDAGEKAGSQ